MIKVSYLSGPANFPSILAFQRGQVGQTFFGTNYMKLFIDFVEEVDAKAQVVTWVDDDQPFVDEQGRFELINRPLPRVRGWRFHQRMIAWNRAMLRRMLAFRPDVLLLTGNQDYWWLYAPLLKTGTKVIASFHCVQWPVVGKQRLHRRIFARLNAALILRRTAAILVTSQAIRSQVEEMLASNSNIPILDHLPTYERSQFAGIPAASMRENETFQVLFVGRIEENKGVFDLLTIARELAIERPGRFRFHFCGEGTQLAELRRRVLEGDLGSAVSIHGQCDVAQLRNILSETHACIVPTRSDFEAGFEMTCAEAILAGRPLITSRVCPALDYLRGATIEVPPDDVGAYKQAILTLAEDPRVYSVKQGACAELSEQFFDPSNSWTAALRKAWKIAGVA